MKSSAEDDINILQFLRLVKGGDAMISFDENSRIFHLQTKNTSYVFGVYKMNHLIHLYWGKKITPDYNWDRYFMPLARGFSARDDGFDRGSTDLMRMEYPTYGSCDLRTPAFNCVFDDGTSVPQLRYVSHRIIDGKPGLAGMPATYAEEGDSVQTLEVELADSLKDLHVILSYSVFEDYDAITRSVRVVNNGPKCRLTSVMSASVDIPQGEDYDFMHLDGAWARERHICRTPMFCGRQTVDSKRGASGQQHNPFVGFPKHNTTESAGDMYGMNLVYSGNFEAGAEVDTYGTARTFIGVNPFNFGYVLENGESFQAPEAVLVYSPNGIGGMSRIYHKLYRERLCRGKFRDTERYVLVNNWESTYFKFDEEKLLSIAEKAKEVGLDMFVLDDGWFGNRNSDNCSLGDWYENREKLPNGLSGLADKLNAMGLKFGLWFEPEMVSPDSDLYRAHPDWALHVNGRISSLSRNQLILDLSRDDVCDYIIDSLTKVLSNANIEYVKWDMNRNMTEIGSDKLPAERQGEVCYRYIVGLYRVLETITSRFPNILFESCSGGGGRFDPGMLYYMPQTWCSDDTDALERSLIQYGTSICYPFSAMGAHVSACPNHQVRRTTPFKARGDVATVGQFGYELDLAKLTDEELNMAKEQVKRYRALGEVFHRGDCYRLLSPFEGNLTAMNFISEDKKTVVLWQFVLKTYSAAKFTYVKLEGLDPDADYTERSTGKTYKGDFLMNIGLQWPFNEDYQSEITVFDKV